ncbi:MAG: TetR/AcrR family transcriptional regulator [Candidatus Odinarchaeota archaeon]
MTKQVPDKKQAVLDAALTLFTDCGFHGTPTSKIAKQAGVATGTLFHYFKTKEELINTLYYNLKEELGREIMAGYEEIPTIEGKFKHMWVNSINWGINNPLKFHFLEHYSSSPFIKAVSHEEFMKNYIKLYDIYREGVDKELLRNISVELAVNTVYYAIKGVVLQILSGSQQNNEDKLINESFDLIWNGLSTRKKEE